MYYARDGFSISLNLRTPQTIRNSNTSKSEKNPSSKSNPEHLEQFDFNHMFEYSNSNSKFFQQFKKMLLYGL